MGNVTPYNNVNYTVVAMIPGTEIIRRAYKAATKQPEYVGYAPRGTADSASVWVIRKYTYNVNNQISSEDIAVNTAWDDRETASYS